MKKYIISFSNKHPRWYGFIYLLLFMFLLTALAFLPYIYRAIVYPTFYEKQEMSGVIEAIIVKNTEMNVKYNRSTDMPTYFFDINDTYVRVTPSIVREYNEGDVYHYIQYSRDGKVIGESREYSVLWAMIGLLVEVLIFYAVISFFRIDTKGENEEGELSKEYIVEEGVSYNTLSTGELFELCQKRNIHVIKGKRNNRQYLECCLRSNDERSGYGRRVREKSNKGGLGIIGLMAFIVLMILVVVINYVRFIYYFVYLFT